jgi:hypothetical protein
MDSTLVTLLTLLGASGVLLAALAALASCRSTTKCLDDREIRSRRAFCNALEKGDRP